MFELRLNPEEAPTSIYGSMLNPIIKLGLGRGMIG
jgi:hypothetical protein